ncbi:MAG: glycosyltransferase family 4 protein [Legionellaceae bacterium]|nr:glycosyltransferase family 4 protein [Legionellaceae bacterium]
MFGLLAVVFVMSWSLTWCARRYALAKQMMDIPNHRSSHQIPTPRGGGVAFVVVFLVAMLCLLSLRVIQWPGGFTLMGAAFFIAFLGFCDDRSSIPALWRFIGHFMVSIIAVYAMKGMPAIACYTWVLYPGYLANAFAVVYLVWMVNLYNFMDGIDGIAGIEGIFVCLGGAILYWSLGYHASMILPLILATATTGFLYWNFPPARIFMGDAGSGFLGFILGILSIQAAGINPQFFWSWLILLGVFIVDATVTLCFRLMQGEKIHMAHRSHAYQYASRMFNSHLSVTLGVLLLNILWLWPLAMCVGLGYLNGLIGLLIAYVPLGVIAIQFNAGQRSKEAS